MDENNNNKKMWFGNKTYGYGWVPNSWQGWVSIGVWGVAVFLSTGWFASKEGKEPQETYTLLYTLMLLLSTAGLVVVSKLKGPKPKWRWGKD
jgi:hypothetical protein